MQTSSKTIGLTLLMLAFAALLAHGSVNRKAFASNGHRLSWPAIGSVTPMHKGGTFPDLDKLRQVSSGMNKQQIAQLIDGPHFNTGAWFVHEWDYVFNFRDTGSGQVSVCQYKILFDRRMRARSFHWNPGSCQDWLMKAAGAAASIAPRPYAMP